MGHGVPVMEMRGPRARMMLAAEYAAHGRTQDDFRAAVAAMDKVAHDALTESARLRAKCEAQEASLSKMVDAYAEALQDASAVPYLMDMVTELQLANNALDPLDGVTDPAQDSSGPVVVE